MTLDPMRLASIRHPFGSEIVIGRRWALLLSTLMLLACGGEATTRVPTPGPLDGLGTDPTGAVTPRVVVLSIVGTNDLHGRIARLPQLGGYVRNLRSARDSDGGGVLLVDAGDMFQGTIESNSSEGAPVVRAYNALDYRVSAVGNHEFDFGPVGSATTPESPDDDPRGALIARASEARFPFLTANILDAASGERVDWPNMPPTAMVQVAGVRVGFVGVTTEDTLVTTIAGNVSDLRMAPLAASIEQHALALRQQGASVVVVTAHAGGDCGAHGEPDDLDSCDPHEEIFDVARALPEGLVDVIVAGHTHKAVSHRVNGIAIIESLAYGVAFGRIDVTVDRQQGTVSGVVIHPPRFLCRDPDEDPATCDLGEYEGAPVRPDDAVFATISDDLRRAEGVRSEPLGVRLEGAFVHSRSMETPLGNLLADLILEAQPEADLALMNGGGIRATLPAGDLTYGQLYETYPFDNRFALVEVTGAELEGLLARNLAHDGSILSVSGIRVRARCVEGRVQVEVRRESGRPVRARERLTIATSDYLATTPDEAFARAAENGRLAIDGGSPMREAIVSRLRERGGALRPDDPHLHDPDRPRMSFSDRPMRCD